MSANATFVTSAPTAPRVSSAAATPRASRRAIRVSWGRYLRTALATITVAVAANTAFYYLAQLAVAYNPDFIVLSNPSGAMIFTVVPAIVATLMYAALVRFTFHPERIFDVIAAIVFVVTLIPDFTYIPTVDGATNGQTAVLVAMHVIAAAAIVGMLTRRSFTRSSR